MSTTTEKIGVKLASALLLHYGELSIEDIRAMPFLTQPDEAEIVIRRLSEMFNVEIYSKKVSSYPMPEWEKMMRIKKR